MLLVVLSIVSFQPCMVLFQ